MQFRIDQSVVLWKRIAFNSWIHFKLWHLTLENTNLCSEKVQVFSSINYITQCNSPNINPSLPVTDSLGLVVPRAVPICHLLCAHLTIYPSVWFQIISATVILIETHPFSIIMKEFNEKTLQNSDSPIFLRKVFHLIEVCPDTLVSW